MILCIVHQLKEKREILNPLGIAISVVCTHAQMYTVKDEEEDEEYRKSEIAYERIFVSGTYETFGRSYV